jgi:serine/threonine-protein kinase
MSYEPGQRVGDYEIQEVLGAGGMGEVYKVRNVISDRLEAMKILLPDLAGQQELANRFLREIKVLASLDHPNIAQLRTALHIGNQLVMIMELLEGVTLAHRLKGGPFPESEAVECVCQVLAALGYAHARGIVHRDIKPANMMLTRDGVIKLMDFGIARAAGETKLTMTGSTLGSIYYMSPEQVQGQNLDARSDLYSLGVSLYELVTGLHPFEGETGFTIMKGHIEGVFTPPRQVNPALSAALNEIVVMAMAKDPDGRFQTADAFARALESIRKAGGGIGVAAPAAAIGAASGAAAATTPTRPAFQTGAPRPATGITPPSSPPPGTLGGAPAQPGGAALQASRPLETMASATQGGAGTPPLPPQQVPPAAPQTFAGQPATPQTYATGAAQPPPQPMPSSKRAFYIGLGSALTLVFLVLTAMKLPMFRGNTPDSKPAPVASPAAPAPAIPTPVTPPPATLAPDTPAANRAPAAPAAPVAKTKPSGPSAAEQKAAAEAAAAQAAAQAAAEEAARLLDEQEKRFVGMSARAGAMKDSFNQLTQQQAAAGYGPSSAISTPFHTMEQYMSRAEAALAAGDGAAAKKYMDLAEPNIAALEKKFGR